MKILQVNCVYNTGSTGKLMNCISTELKNQKIDNIICYGRGKKIVENNVYKTCNEVYAKINNLVSRVTGIVYGGCWFSTKKLIRIIKNEKPDIVQIHCINGYFVNIYKLIEWLNKNKVRTVITLHAEFMYTANCAHAYECTQWKKGCGKCPSLKEATRSWGIDNTALSFKKMQNAFEGFNDNLVIVSVSSWLMKRAKMSPILENKRHKVILNGIDTNIFNYINSKELKMKYCKMDEKMILYVAPYFSDAEGDPKGGEWIVKLAKKNRKYKIVVVGEIRTKNKMPDNIVLVDKIIDQKQLAYLYSAADVCVITSKRETFSMVVAESLCCGTPVVGFKAGGPEEISIAEYTEYVEYGNIDLLDKTVYIWCNKNNMKEMISKVSRENYSSERMVKSYIELYGELYEKNICQ